MNSFDKSGCCQHLRVVAGSMNQNKMFLLKIEKLNYKLNTNVLKFEIIAISLYELALQ